MKEYNTTKKKIGVEEWQAMAQRIHAALSIPTDYQSRRGVTLFPEAEKLVLICIDYQGKPFRLEPDAALAWQELDKKATQDGVQLLPFSGFRSYKYQLDLIRTLLSNGQDLEQVLTKLAAPGFSEHHSGKAVDINEDGCSPTSKEFEETKSFSWLTKNAKDFGFHMTYPENNQFGFIYEPWHWAYVGS